MDAIITVDEDHRVILFNEAAEKVFGCPAAEVMGQTLDRFIPELFRNGNPVAGSGETGGAGSSQASLHALTAFRADGAAFPIEAAISSTEIGGRNLLTIIHRDVTERRQAEAEREQLAREQAARTTAEAANRSKDDFLALVSHELRSPLTAILGYARLLRSDLADRETVNRGAAVIERSAKSQLQIIEDLLDSARIASGKLRIEFERVDLVPVVEAALDTARPAAEAKGISLVADFGPAREQLLGDSTRLQQVVWNLLSNAVKFTPEAGRVELEMKASGDDIKITVTDNGSGIEPSFLPSVFERFRQADSSSTRRVGGLGVGLSLVKHLVELHGGTITAQSGGPGRGSRFTVALPRQRIEFMAPTGSAAGPGEMPATDAPTLDRTASLEGVNVLVVDDQEDARVLLTRALTEFGARVTAVSSGMEALSMLRNSPSGARFDALILDIAMPGEDGYAVLKKVRALELDERVAERMPAIALTAFAGSEDKTRALQAGFQIHVAKPVEPAELAGVINSLVNRRMRGRGRGHRA
jgi:PAS domain S-box-containing protein